MKSIISGFGRWFQERFSKILSMSNDPLLRALSDIPPPNFKRQDILNWLNSLNQGKWMELSGYFAYNIPTFTPMELNFQKSIGGIVLILFMNLNTGEVKSFVAKFLDVPEEHRRQLWKG